LLQLYLHLFIYREIKVSQTDAKSLFRLSVETITAPLQAV